MKILDGQPVTTITRFATCVAILPFECSSTLVSKFRGTVSLAWDQAFCLVLYSDCILIKIIVAPCVTAPKFAPKSFPVSLDRWTSTIQKRFLTNFEWSGSGVSPSTAYYSTVLSWRPAFGLILPLHWGYPGFCWIEIESRRQVSTRVRRLSK